MFADLPRDLHLTILDILDPFDILAVSQVHIYGHSPSLLHLTLPYYRHVNLFEKPRYSAQFGRAPYEQCAP